MIDEILINVSPFELRVALLASGELQELFIERNADEGHVGNIYCGKVVRVLPGMQAAFVDIGFERTAFLHIDDIDCKPLKKPAAALITDVVRPGQLINVQIMKDPIGTKGARLTTHFSLSSQYFVYMPYAEKGGVSQRIDTPKQRLRLKQLLSSSANELGIDGAFIVRTAAEGLDTDALQADMSLLHKQWQSVAGSKVAHKTGALIYQELSMVQLILRDAVQASVGQVLVDDETLSLSLQTFAENFVPEAANKISYYEGRQAIFDAYSIEAEISKALSRRVDLKSGGYVIFDQTEAMTTVDVNTGAFVGKTNLEQTAYITNLEAAAVIAQQLRIRNLGGMVIVDFIDMLEASSRSQINQALDQALSQDRAKTSRHALKELGLVALTRKRSRESLEHVLCDTCLACDGSGRVRSLLTLVGDIFREIYRRTAQLNKQQLVLIVAPAVGELLLGETAKQLADLGLELGLTIKVQVDVKLVSDCFDVILL